MKKFLIFSLLLSLLLALPVPQLKGYLNDQAGILTEQQAKAVENYLKSFDEQTSNQIFILTLDSLKGEPLFDYSLKVAEQWQPGVEGKDNGVLLLIAKKERKIRIEVGYGLEGELTDAESGEIIRYAMVPHFREGNFDRGIIHGVYALTESISGEFKPSRTDTSYANQAVDNRVNAVFLISIFLGLISWGFFNSGKKKTPAIFGVIAAALILSILGLDIPLLLAILLVFIGGPIYAFLVMLILMLFISTRFGYYGGGYHGSSGGGFGGFSGGGGGSFGGGGASGSW